MRNTMRQGLRSEQGFTLIELVVVMLVLMILTAVAVPSYLGFRERANRSAAGANVRSAISSIEAWHSDHATYTGMTVAALRASYDLSLSASVISLGSLTTTSYCVMANSWHDPTKTAAKAGPDAPVVIGATCP